MNTSRPKLSLKSTLSVLPHSGTGQKVEKSNISDPSGVDVCTTNKMFSKFSDKIKPKIKLKKKDQESSMQESASRIKLRISKDKFNSCSQNIPQIQSSKISVPVSTGKEKGLKPFWNKYTKEISQRLWSPTKIDCVDSDSNCSNGSAKNMTPKSWFSILSQKQKTEPKNWQKIYSLLSLSSSQKTTASDPPTTAKTEIKVRKIKMLPNLQQKIKLRTWFGIYRWIYNQGVTVLKSNNYDHGSLLKQLRNKLIKNSNYKKENRWVSELPADTRDYAIKELLQAFKTNLKSGHHFNIRFKSKKRSQSMEIRTRQYTTKRGCYHFLSEIKKTEKIPELTHDIKVQMDRDGSFYMIIPIDVTRNENQVPQRIISIDPGIRTLITGYAPDGFTYQMGYNDIRKLSRLLRWKNELQSSVAKHCRHNKNRIRHALKRSYKRIKNLVDECHKKVTAWLFQNFDHIIIPKLDTNSLCRKKMNKLTKNKISVWRHCSLIERLKNKNREFPDTKLIILTEEYTSKTCSKCGELHKNLGMNRDYHCQNTECETIFERDVNGSINILLKHLTEISNEHNKEAENLINDWI